MKELNCPECKSFGLTPPPEGKRKWTCSGCGHKFKIRSKDAGKILRHADEKGLDLGSIESFLISAILKKDKKKTGKKGKKGKKKKKHGGSDRPAADEPALPV